MENPTILVIQLDFLDGISLCFFLDSDQPITNLLLELSLVSITGQQSEPAFSQLSVLRPSPSRVATEF